MNDARVFELLDEWTPSYDDRHGDWDRVAAAARGRRGPVRLVLVAAAMVAAAALVLAWPFHSSNGTLLERARAAMGSGTVLHVVLRGEWGGTLVDLRTGERTPVYGDDEYWYDTNSGRVHEISRLGAVVQNEELYGPQKPPLDLAALGRTYKRALENGTAQVAEEATLDREPVTWITIQRKVLPDVSDGREHVWEQQVAVSRKTYKAVALREARDGKPGPGTERRVRRLDLVQAGDFTADESRSLDGLGFGESRRTIPRAEAQAVLGRAPLWLGEEFGGLPLAQLERQATTVVRRSRIRLTGNKERSERSVLACVKRPDAGGCFRTLGLGSIEVGGDGVFTDGPVAWTRRETSLVLFYGTLGDDKTTFRRDHFPLYDQPHVTLTESTDVPRYRPAIGSYVPPAGSAFLAAGGQSGSVFLDGVHVAIETDSPREILAVARALEPMPS
jgi:hypothetical protein